MLNGEGPLDLLMDQEEQVIDKESNFYLQDANNDYVQPSDDDPFYLANRTFYTTCHKISRQNSPSYRKRPPYTFLENWFIHLVFSKSQQILLRFPVIQPRVMMTEGDFIYTPHQMATTTHSDQFDQQQQHHYQQQHHHYDYDYGEEDEDEEEDYDYDDTFIIGDEGVMVMSASAPDASQLMMMDDTNDMSVVMDENMWMGHSRYNQNGPSLHVVNSSPLDDDEDREEPDPMYHNHNHQLNTNNPYRSIVSSSPYNLQLQVVKEEDEEDEEEEDEDEGEEEEEGYQEEDESEEDVYEKEEKGDMVNTKENKEKAIVHEQRQQHNQNHPEHDESESDEMSDDDDDDDEEEEIEAAEEEEVGAGEESEPMHCSLSISPEIIDWYRSGDLRPVKSTSDLLQQLGCENPHQPEFKVRTQSSGSSSSSNSSTHSSSNSICSISSNQYQHHHHHHHQRTDEVVVVEKNPRHSSDSYQSLADMIPDTSYGTLLPMYRKPSASSQQSRPILNTSISFVNSVLVAVDMAQNYAEDGQGGVSGFISCMFNICKVFFLGAEGFFVKNTSLV